MATRPLDSSNIRVHQITRENTNPAVAPPTQQTFEIAMRMPQGHWQNAHALLTRRNAQLPTLSLLDDDREVLSAHEITPALAGRFHEVSVRRRPFTIDDAVAYAAVHERHADLFAAPGIEKLPASIARDWHLGQVMDDPDGGSVLTHVVQPDNPTVLRTTGVANCIAIGATGLTAGGETVLGLLHYTGQDMDAPGHPLEQPEHALGRLTDGMAASGAQPGTVRIVLAGGEQATADSNDANRLGQEAQMLALRDRFPIVAARLHETVVDINSDGKTIARFTDDDHNAAIDAVMTPTGMLIAHAGLDR